MFRQLSRHIIQFILASAMLLIYATVVWAQNPILSDQKPGSVLFFNHYINNGTADTQLNITNTSTTDNVTLNLFFIRRNTCGTIGTRILSLITNQTISVPAPAGEGYAIAVAVNATNHRPFRHNFLIGNAYIREAGGARFADLPAVAIAKITTGAVMNNGDGTATLNFNGTVYDRLPRVVAIDSFNSQVTDSTNLILYSPVRDLTAPPVPLTPLSIFGLVYNNSAVVRSTSFTETCYGVIPLSSLRVLSTLNGFVPLGQTGLLRMYAPDNSPLMGATMSSGPLYTTGHNLHHLTLQDAPPFTMRVPIF